MRKSDQRVAEVVASWRDAELAVVSANMQPQPSGPILICVCKNEGWRLPCLLEHYRALGVEHFVFVDNGSTDDTRTLLAGQPGVDTYLCRAPFSTYAQRGWLHQVIARYGFGKWYLCVDADEFVVYSGMDSHTLGDLAGLAEREGADRIRGIFVDMYGPGPLREYEHIETCPDVMAYCRYFDSAGYTAKVASTRVEVQGGP